MRNSAWANRFRAASKLYRDWGAAEHYSDLKQDYLALAENMGKSREQWELRSKTIEPEMKQMKEAVHYVKASATFLERLEEHLDLYDGWAHRSIVKNSSTDSACM